MIINTLNSFIFKYIRFIEMLGVLMRIFSFSLVSWMGAESPFMFVWAFNTTDAVNTFLVLYAQERQCLYLAERVLDYGRHCRDVQGQPVCIH